MVKSSTYRVQCTSDQSFFVISLMAIAKRVTLSTLPCGRPPPAQNILGGRPTLLRKTPGKIGSPQQRLEGFLLGPFHACNLIFLVSIQCRKPSLRSKKTATVCFFSLNSFSIWHVSWVRASVFSKARLFWAKDIVIFQEPPQSVVHPPLKQLADAAC